MSSTRRMNLAHGYRSPETKEASYAALTFVSSDQSIFGKEDASIDFDA